MLGTATAGLILGLGGMTVATSFVQASERGGIGAFFESLFGVAPAPAPVPVVRPSPRPGRYSSLPDARRVGAAATPRWTPRPVAAAPSRTRPRPPRAERASAALTASALGSRTVCVRACDGYLFPVGRLRDKRDLPVHQAACAAACPNAPTALYTLGGGETELDRAVSLTGQPYARLASANLFRVKRVDQCSCQPEGVAAAPLPLDRDLTLRAGDVVATNASARVVVKARSGGFEVVDFRQAKGLSRRARLEIDAKVDVIRREADARAFRKTLRTAERGARVQLAQVGGFQPLAPPIEVEPAFSAVRVVVPSPFKP
ncbi:DUF2865 domain-containing protein [Methylobacterium sp. Leaf466]|uniref:DUF2865 domain-containing protein n=1 Tax=Methylobacterium sp. Leaf466 TaxID=1736386 RepID=UPI0006FE1461|nr:DUF2865 domain-containing protein [Methylobacterium sp. Leaf466]KQT77730.1 hypothetical protein ASG59_10330 [Methylobacterium sp. Leaf466]